MKTAKEDDLDNPSDLDRYDIEVQVMDREDVVDFDAASDDWVPGDLYSGGMDFDDEVYAPLVADVLDEYKQNIVRFLALWRERRFIEGKDYTDAEARAIRTVAELICDNGGRHIRIGKGVFVSADYVLNSLNDTGATFRIVYDLVFMGAKMRIDSVTVTKKDRLHFAIEDADISFHYSGLYELCRVARDEFDRDRQKRGN